VDGVRVLADAPGAYTPASWTEAFNGIDWPQAIQLRVVTHPGQRRALLPDADVHLASSVSAAELVSARRLRLLHSLTAGADVLRSMKLPPGARACTCAGVAAHGLAEHALMLMLALSRQLPRVLALQARWSWDKRGIRGRVLELRGRSAAVLGLGHAGRRLARLLADLEMRVLTWDGRAEPATPPEGVVSCPTLDATLAASDFVVLCLPDTPLTKGLIGQDALQAMRKGACLVNVSRGSLVDSRALAHALRRGHLAGAALDVLDEEPPGRRHPLRHAPNLIVTPHMAGNMHAYRGEIQARCVENVRRLLVGQPLLGELANRPDYT
jgi:phosphoglycerate dehydrogenase-like enzyme